ncbi:xanthine dehydrogenase family protein molybdopterin-binding subunit [Olivibacter sitiensis]|uniref:xanthine dehydrogenase family protein molybdopterin-binding subunit n=1 Tax=Olivibacter sitiensis TaxID=376470 RepID=UPI000486EFCE|nr:molybdopterin cofactor-binding domain-containing protein [Olivibacter sitiensis]
MTLVKTTLNRRSFLRAALLAGGGMVLSFSWMAGCKPSGRKALEMPEEWFELNSYIKIGENGVISLSSPNPEFGQNVKTSMPMILAEELDVDWDNVVVEQADFLPDRFKNQFTGGSQAIRSNWTPLRTVGATARQMLILAAAKHWNVPATEITTEPGILLHKASGKQASYGEMASAASQIPIPEEVELKKVSDFKIIGTSKKNVDVKNIVNGKPLFSLDYKTEGMLTAMIVHPPAFGMQLKSIDDSAAITMPGIQSIFTIDTLTGDIDQNFFDATSFTKMAVVVGNSTWEVMQAKKALKIAWEEEPERVFRRSASWMQGSEIIKATFPPGLESTDDHLAKMAEFTKKPGQILRRDGDPEGAFKKASKIIERTYTAPFLAHNTMEPVNCFAHVTAEKAELYGPLQAPEYINATLSQRLGLPKDKIHIKLARMGGGFGLRAYGHHLIEAAVISQQVKAPVKLVYTREDEMTAGLYRPAYSATYRAALDENNQLIAFHVKGGGIPEMPVAPHRFPAGAIDNYLAEGWSITSNITTGIFRAPRSNFMACAEQSFLDELAAEMGKDPIDFRLELLERAKTAPVGENNDYQADRYAGVLRLARDKSNWNETKQGIHRGVSAYFCHNSYVAEVVDLVMKNGTPKVEKVVAAIDCGIVVNKDAAVNMAEGAIVDGIGNALFGEMPFKDGAPQKNNFPSYRMIRANEAPKEIDVHFVGSETDPTGMGEPPFAPVFAAVANALYKATGTRFYNQPFINGLTTG